MKRGKFALTFIFFLISLTLAGWLFALLRIYSTKNDILDLRRTLLENKKQEENSAALRRFTSSVQEEGIKINSLFLNENGLIRLIEGLESLGENSGLELNINSVSVSDDKGKPRVSFSAEGTFNQIFQYLYHMDNFPYPLSVEKASFQKLRESKEEKVKNKEKWKVVFEVKLESYENN